MANVAVALGLAVLVTSVLIDVKVRTATNHILRIVLMENIMMWCIASIVKAHFDPVIDTLHAATVRALVGTAWIWSRSCIHVTVTIHNLLNL